MANTKSAKKRARQTIRRTARNFTVRSELKTAIRTAREAFQTKGGDVATSVKDAVSTLAKAANKGIVHPRNAARRISRLMSKAAKLQAGGSAITAPTKKAPTKKAAPKAAAPKAAAKKPAARPAAKK